MKVCVFMCVVFGDDMLHKSRCGGIWFCMLLIPSATRIEEMIDLGYTSEIIPLAHDEYGGCTTRKRVYLVGLHAEALGISSAAAAEMVTSIAKKVLDLKLPSTNFQDFLLADDHPYVVKMKQNLTPAETQALMLIPWVCMFGIGMFGVCFVMYVAGLLCMYVDDFDNRPCCRHRPRCHGLSPFSPRWRSRG